MSRSPSPQGISSPFNSTPIRIFHTPTTEQTKIESEPSSPITDVFYFKLPASGTTMFEREEGRGFSSVQPPKFPTVTRPTIFPPTLSEASHTLEAIARDGTPRNEIPAPKKKSKMKQLLPEGAKTIDFRPSITHMAPKSQGSFGDKAVSASLASPADLKPPKLGDRQRGLALQKIIREIESSLWMSKKPSPHLAMMHERDARRLGVEVGASYSPKTVSPMSFLKGTRHPSNNLVADVSSSDAIDVIQVARKVMPKKEAVCTANEASVAATERYTTTARQHISASPKTAVNIGGSLFPKKTLNSSIQPPTPIPPHLRSLDPTTTNHLLKRSNVLTQPAKTVPPKSLIPATTIPNAQTRAAGIATGNPSRAPPPVKKAPNFKIPQNPHAAGYNIAAVLRDPNERVDVKGLKFTAWPKPVNRGDMPIQEARAVIISDLPLQPTLTMISLVCKNTGKLEDVVIDVVRRKVSVTFIEATVAHNFYTQAQKSLEFVSRNSKDGTTIRKRLFVQMDYPIDMLPYGMQERIFSGNGSRMVFFGGWEKHSLEKLVGNGTGEYEELDVLLVRLAESYVQGDKTGRIEGVTLKEEGWGFYEGGLLYAGIREGIAAFDGLKLEPEFKGCNVRFGKDPCEPSC